MRRSDGTLNKGGGVAKLTDEQIQFLNRLGVPVEKTFDATGLSKSYYRQLMKERSLEVAYGVNPCKRGGHTLRSRSGHCIQCNTANLRYQNRYSESGFLYLATSALGGVIKFGQTKNVVQRRMTLNESSYGGFDDWSIVSFARINEAGKVEAIIHSHLSHMRVFSDYSKDGTTQSASEIFKLSVDEAKIIFEKYSKI